MFKAGKGRATSLYCLNGHDYLFVSSIMIRITVSSTSCR